MLDSRPLLLASDFPRLRRRRPATLQVNLGYRCNMTCAHCHVNAGPTRTEMMSRATADETLDALFACAFETLDLTGGAPELNPNFRRMVKAAAGASLEVIDRCNLTVLFEPGQRDLAAFLAEHAVTVVASLPCYEEENVASQRGKEAWNGSIEGLRELNRLGYGRREGLSLHLVHNPTGPSLPAAQEQLEADYRKVLRERWGIEFNDLYALANMPIKRFGGALLATDQFDPYMRLLKDNFQADNLQTVMCRDLVSVDWRGHLYDCDFNQMLDLPLAAPGADGKSRAHVRDLAALRLEGAGVTVGEHCYACAAGQGSSCGGALN